MRGKSFGPLPLLGRHREYPGIAGPWSAGPGLPITPSPLWRHLPFGEQGQTSVGAEGGPGHVRATWRHLPLGEQGQNGSCTWIAQGLCFCVGLVSDGGLSLKSRGVHSRKVTGSHLRPEWLAPVPTPCQRTKD